MKKAYLFLIAIIACALIVNADEVNQIKVHKKDGTITRINSANVTKIVTEVANNAMTQTIYQGEEGTQFNALDVDSVVFKYLPYTLEDTWTAYDAFHKVCFDTRTKLYKQSTNTAYAIDRWNGCAAIWCQPMYLDMAMNAYKRALAEGDETRATKYKSQASQILRYNKMHYVNFNFDDANTNTGWFIYDDIQWWTITLARYAKLFDDANALTYAQKAYARVWYGSDRVGDNGSYADPAKGMSGGMFWQWQPIENPEKNVDDHARMACINFPTVIAALELYEAMDENTTADTNPKTWSNSYGDFVRPNYETKQRYLEMAIEIYDFAAKNLFSRAMGLVYDSCRGFPNNYSYDSKAHVYNQATMIGASVKLYKITGKATYLDNAKRAAKYVFTRMSNASTNYLLPWESGIEQGIYTTILSQYMAELIYDCGETTYLEQIRNNIFCGWENRDRTRDICSGKYGEPVTEGADIDSYSASGIPALMLLFPPE